MSFPSLSLSKTKTETTPLLKESLPQLRGYLYLLISAGIYSFASLFIHVALTKYAFSTLSSAIIRAIIPIVLSIFSLSRIDPPSLTAKQLRLLAARGMLGATSLFSNYEALRRIPIGTVDTICATAPAVTAMFCAVFLKESVTRLEICALVASLIGVVLVAQSSSPADHLYGPPWVGALLAVASTVFTSAACTFVRAMGTRVHSLHNVLALSLGVAVCCALFSRTPDYEAVVSNPPATVLLTVATVLTFAGAFLYNAGLQICRAGPGLLISTVKIPLSYMLGLFFLREQFGTGAIAGALLIVAAAATVGLSSAVRNETDEREGNSDAIFVEKMQARDGDERITLCSGDGAG